MPASCRQWISAGLLLHLQEYLETTLPEQATLDEAVELYLADERKLGARGRTGQCCHVDVLDALKARGETQRPVDIRSADEMDDLAERPMSLGIL